MKTSLFLALFLATSAHADMNDRLPGSFLFISHGKVSVDIYKEGKPASTISPEEEKCLAGAAETFAEAARETGVLKDFPGSVRFSFNYSEGGSIMYSTGVYNVYVSFSSDGCRFKSMDDSVALFRDWISSKRKKQSDSAKDHPDLVKALERVKKAYRSGDGE